MAYGDDESCDRDDRTIYVGQLPDKITKDILYELFFQAGPIERVSIPTDQDGRLKNFGFVTYKHLSSVDYAMKIFAGTRLYGKEILLKNRNGGRNRDSMNSQHRGYNNTSSPAADLSPLILQQQQQLIQQQLLLLATGSLQNYAAAGAQMFDGSPHMTDSYASTRNDVAGSHREHFVDRGRYHRDRTDRNKPYRRSRSRSPHQHSYNSQKSRDRSPVSSHRNRTNARGEKSNYHRWGKN